MVSAATGEGSDVIPPPFGKVNAIITQLSGKAETLNWSLLRSSHSWRNHLFSNGNLFLMMEECSRTSKTSEVGNNCTIIPNLHFYSGGWREALRYRERRMKLCACKVPSVQLKWFQMWSAIKQRHAHL